MQQYLIHILNILHMSYNVLYVFYYILHMVLWLTVWYGLAACGPLHKEPDDCHVHSLFLIWLQQVLG